MSRRRRGWSDITVTDQFCGAGGSTIGAKRAGLNVRLAMNHWKRAVETYNTNHPDTEVHCADVSAQDPRRFPSTDILITSPECTTHSPAGGNRRWTPDLFTQQQVDDPAFVRSRATMRDVPRFAEYHEYRMILVENVVEVTRWGPNNDGSLFRHWLQEMQLLGYQWKLVSLNSMFCWPTPQSRDRLYIVFWRKGDRAPDMVFTPQAPCHRCEKVVHAIQAWKAGALRRAIAGQPYGKYRTQYVYECPVCKSDVVPFYFAALNAIDFSLPAERIGDRSAAKQLKPRTLERIRYGLNKYGNRHLIIRTNMTSGVGTRVRGLDEPHMAQTASWLDALFTPFVTPIQGSVRAKGLDDVLPTQVAECSHDALIAPMVVETAYSHAEGREPRPIDEALFTQSARQTLGFAFNVAGRDADAPFDRAIPTLETREKFGLCFLAQLRGGTDSHRKQWAVGLDEAIGTVSAGGNQHALIGTGFAPFITMRRGRDHAIAGDEVIPTVTTGEHHLLVQDAAQISMRDANAMRVAGLDEEFRTQGTKPQMGLIQRAPFLTSYYGNHQAAGVEEAMDTVTVRDRHALVSPERELRVEDCYFRMLQPHEIGAAMAFPGDYTVTGNKRDQVKQYGNAVTPPAMDHLVRRALAALAPEAT